MPVETTASDVHLPADALLALVEECRQSRIRVRIAEVPPAVDSVIRLLNLDQFLSIDATEADSRSELEAA